ncbi:MAG TPA: hypothetical protein VJO33_08475 [Gemmatimonadaceae bacterium]|nr:hypothetical protein [Gemmatimonadaceae bacterium]
MTFGAPETGTPTTARIPSIVILGADALLAARPATPIQLAHACALAGYQNVVPASWGDELIATASLRALREHGHIPAIQCSCPHVARRLLAAGTELRPFLISLVAPPVVLARYLRAMHAPRTLRITYVGRCPGAVDESIDARLAPEELLATFVEQRIPIDEQPDVFDSVIPPDRRRFRSQPGGLPTAEMLCAGDLNGNGARSLVELYGDELPVELAEHLLAGKPVLIDVAPKLGCVCSGAAGDVDPANARARVTELEPPRALSPVLDERVLADATLLVPANPLGAIDVLSLPAIGAEARPVPNDLVPAATAVEPPISRAARPETASTTAFPHAVGGRRHSPSRGMPRVPGGALPTARAADGRQLPRSYVAWRRSPARLMHDAPLESEAPILTSTEQSKAPEPNGGEPHMGAAPSPMVSSPSSVVPPPLAVTVGSAVAETGVPSWAPTTRVTQDDVENGSRFTERAVTLPVTPLSDARPREQTPASQVGDRPVMQLLTLGLLISMIVLVSAAVGVLVGRWMTQR